MPEGKVYGSLSTVLEVELRRTVVVERRGRSRRERATSAAGAGADRRAQVERREYLPNHHITLGPVSGAGRWNGGVCSCGEHILSRVMSLVVDWARGHRTDVLSDRASFVHSS